jgi:hypothetical protein
MKNTLLFILFILSASAHSVAQSKETGIDRDAIKQYMNNKDTMPDLRQAKNIELVKNVLKRFKNAVEALDVTGSERFFTGESDIYENGISEGNYIYYLEHHLVPELKEFKSFAFNDYKVEIQIDGNYAFAAETYNYVIVLAKDNTEIKYKGVTTSILRKAKGEWKISVSHNSSRKQ